MEIYTKLKTRVTEKILYIDFDRELDPASRR